MNAESDENNNSESPSAKEASPESSGGYSKHSMHGGDAPTLQVLAAGQAAVSAPGAGLEEVSEKVSEKVSGQDSSQDSGQASRQDSSQDSVQTQMPSRGSEVTEGLNNWSWSRECEGEGSVEFVSEDDDSSESELSAGSFGRPFENGDTARVAGVAGAIGTTAAGGKGSISNHEGTREAPSVSGLMSVRELSRIKQEKRQQEKSKPPMAFILFALAGCALLTALNWSSLIGASDRSLSLSSSGGATSQNAENPNDIFAAFSQIFRMESSDAKLERFRAEYQRAMSDLRLADAQKILDEAISVRREANLLRLRARLNFRRGKREDAFSDWTEALSIAPGDGDVLKDRAWAYCRDDSLDLALADYSALAEQGDMKLKAAGLAGKALVFSMKGNNLQAETFARQALSIEPETAKAHEVLGNCLQKQGDLNGALSEYTAALRIDRSIPEAYSNRALAYLNLGLKESALGDLETVVRLEPDNDHYRFLLGRLAYSMGRKDLALTNLKEAVKLNSSNRKAKQLLAQVSGEQK